MSEWIKIGVWIALVAALLGSHYYLQNKAVIKAVKVTTITIETQYKDKLIKAQQQAADATAKLNSQKVKADEDKANAVQAVSAEYSRIVSELQSRPTRKDLTSSVASAVASARKACTGSELYREDAEFLAGEAARADKVTIERDYYYGRYEDARRILAEPRSTP